MTKFVHPGRSLQQTPEARMYTGKLTAAGLRLPDDLIAEIDDKAGRLGVNTRTAVIRMAVQQYLGN